MAENDVFVYLDGRKIADLVTRNLKYKLTSAQVDKIQQVLEKGDRVELIPAKDGIKIIQETRKEIK